MKSDTIIQLPTPSITTSYFPFGFTSVTLPLWCSHDIGAQFQPLTHWLKQKRAQGSAGSHTMLCNIIIIIPIHEKEKGASRSNVIVNIAWHVRKVPII